MIPPRQMAAHQFFGLPPTLVYLLGVFREIALAQLLERACAPLGHLLGLRVLSFGDVGDQLRRDAPRVLYLYLGCVADREPARSRVVSVDHFEGAMAARLHQHRERWLRRVPDQARAVVVGRQVAHVGVGQLAARGGSPTVPSGRVRGMGGLLAALTPR